MTKIKVGGDNRQSCAPRVWGSNYQGSTAAKMLMGARKPQSRNKFHTHVTKVRRYKLKNWSFNRKAQLTFGIGNAK